MEAMISDISSENIDGNDNWWEESDFGEVCFIVGNLLTYKVSEYHMFKGSNQKRSSGFIVVNLNNGKRIGASDVIKDGMEKEVLKIIGYNNAILGIETFYVTEKGIGFLFTTYDSSSEDNTFDYYVPFTKMKQYLREDFLELLK